MRSAWYVPLALAVVLSIGQVGPVDASVQYRARDIGINGWAYRINNAGQVVGTMYNAEGEERAFLWSDATGVIDIGPGRAIDINSEGRVVGRDSVNQEGFTWKLGEPIRYLGSYYPSAINDFGMIVGSSFEHKPVVWNSYTEAPIILAPFGHLYDINNAGKAVGSAGYEKEAYTWTAADGRRTMPAPDYPAYLYAFCINDNGQIAGYRSGQQSWAVAWQSDTSAMYDLAYIGVGSTAEGINNKGQIVGFYTAATSACLWNTDGTTIDLDALVQADFSRACGINDSGVVVGLQENTEYLNPWGEIYLRQSVIIWEPVPEPASLLALASGVAALGLHARKRSSARA